MITSVGWTLQSPEFKASTNTTSSILDHVSGTFKVTFTAAETAWNASDSKPFESITAVFKDIAVREAIDKFGRGALELGGGSVGVVAVASAQVIDSLNGSGKWQKAVTNLSDSFEVLLMLSTLSIQRLVGAIQMDRKQADAT